ncbi:hypothetical protein AVEN_151474-1 [Araneus ventricosus]|uniref:Uncharacterized protein n=1 Tax=Araneus ventricosus TaxID=182803 RepID=A0A4Y2RX14_ARAVE|nr:hypothetical protein AVEN_151474-1 [Araneus ventricosus]
MCVHILHRWVSVLHNVLFDGLLAVPYSHGHRCRLSRGNRDPCSHNLRLQRIPAIIPYGLPNLTRAQFREMGVQWKDLIVSCRLRNPAGSYTICANYTTWIGVIDTMGLPNNCYAINSFLGKPDMEPYTTMSKSCKSQKTHFCNISTKTAS